MADYDVTLPEAIFPALLAGKEGLAKVIESALNQVLEAQMTEHLGAERYERTPDRDGRYRNGYRERQLFTRVGPITLRVPQTRDGSFFDGDLRTVPAQRTRLRPGADGDVRHGNVVAQGHQDYRGAARCERSSSATLRRTTPSSWLTRCSPSRATMVALSAQRC